MPIFLKHFQETEKEETLPNSLFKARITLLSKSDKDTTRKENYKPIFLTNIDAKIHNEIVANQSNSLLKRSYTEIKWNLSLGCKNASIYANQRVINHINRMRD